MRYFERVRRRNVQRLLYQLQRRFGVPMELYQRTISGPNVTTGDVQDTVTVHRLSRCITFDITVQAVTEYNLSYLSAAKNFTYGLEFEVGDRIVILPKLPVGVEFNNSSYLVYNEHKYEPKKIVEIDFELGYLAYVRRTQGVKPRRIIQRVVQHILSIDQEITHDPP